MDLDTNREHPNILFDEVTQGVDRLFRKVFKYFLNILMSVDCLTGIIQTELYWTAISLIVGGIRLDGVLAHRQF